LCARQKRGISRAGAPGREGESYANIDELFKRRHRDRASPFQSCASMAGRGMRARRSYAGWALRPRIRKAWEPFCAPSWGSRRIDQTNVKIKGRWTNSSYEAAKVNRRFPDSGALRCVRQRTPANPLSGRSAIPDHAPGIRRKSSSKPRSILFNGDVASPGLTIATAGLGLERERDDFAAVFIFAPFGMMPASLSLLAGRPRPGKGPCLSVEVREPRVLVRIDSSAVRAHRSAAGAKGGSRATALYGLLSGHTEEV
jgi:hypothetical protein